jgi:hypothetical protein
MASYLGQQMSLGTYNTGENGHVEYGWSEQMQEKIVQLNFQLTRTTCNQPVLQSKFRELLLVLKNQKNSISLSYLTTLYKLTAYTRDIISGKGEYQLTYMLIKEWYDFFPQLALNMLTHLVHKDNSDHPFGSWKDMKYFSKYCLSNGVPINHEMIAHCISLINHQLKEDIKSDNPSLLAKWIPREKSSFGQMYEPLACDYFKEYLQTAKSDVSKNKAKMKCKTHYRQLISSLNKKLETTQIFQCNQVWSYINFNKVTSITVSKQKLAFLNKLKNGKQRKEVQDRVTCAENFKSHIQESIVSKKDVKGKRVSMEDFTNSASHLLFRSRLDNIDLQVEIDLLNSQWRNNATETKAMGKFIPMVDVSGSMSGTPMAVAIALGIRIAEKSILGNRVITFSQHPSWINLEKLDGFVSKVDVVTKMPWGMNTNFYAALDLILNSIIESKLEPAAVSDLILVILSDMQMDSADSESRSTTLFDNIKNKYHEAGMRVCGKPYMPPHIVMWNLRSTSGFPSLSFQSNATMISGFSPVLLNNFCEKGILGLKESTPWNNLLDSLKKYDYLKEDVIANYIM